MLGQWKKAKRAAELASHVFDAHLGDDMGLAVELYFDAEKRRECVAGYFRDLNKPDDEIRLIADQLQRWIVDAFENSGIDPGKERERLAQREQADLIARMVYAAVQHALDKDADSSLGEIASSAERVFEQSGMQVAEGDGLKTVLRESLARIVRELQQDGKLGPGPFKVLQEIGK